MQQDNSKVSILELIEISRIKKSGFYLILALILQIPLLNLILLQVFFIFSYFFNDIVDIEKDKGRKDKILPRKSKSIHLKLLVGSFVVLMFTLVISLMISIYTFIIFLVGFILSIYYSLFLKHFFPSFAIQVWCFVAVFIFLYQSPFFSISLVILAFSLFYLRELVLDYRDYSYDDRFCTTPTIFKIYR